MDTSKVIAFLCLMLLSCVDCSATGGKPTGCETSGVVYEGTPAHLTCIFDNEINRAGQSFMVYRKESERYDAEIIELCEWEGEQIECRDLNGFRFKSEDHIGRVRFEVKSAKENHSGKYLCKTLPAADAKATECSLTVQRNRVYTSDNIIGCHASRPSVGEQASVSCTFPKSLGMNGIILEKFNDNNGRIKEEIATCDKGGECIVQEGYEHEFKTPTELKVKIPHFSTDQAGIYVCRSTSLPGATAICTLPLPEDGKATKASSLKQIILPLYAILACFLLLILIGLVVFFRRSQCFSSQGFIDRDEKRKAKSLKYDEKHVCQYKS